MHLSIYLFIYYLQVEEVTTFDVHQVGAAHALIQSGQSRGKIVLKL